jgi:hypothetical protein
VREHAPRSKTFVPDFPSRTYSYSRRLHAYNCDSVAKKSAEEDCIVVSDDDETLDNKSSLLLRINSILLFAIFIQTAARCFVFRFISCSRYMYMELSGVLYRMSLSTGSTTTPGIRPNFVAYLWQ